MRQITLDRMWKHTNTVMKEVSTYLYSRGIFDLASRQDAVRSVLTSLTEELDFIGRE